MTRFLFIVAAAAAFACLGMRMEPALAQSPDSHQHSFGGAEHWASYFDDPKRDEWQKPHEVIQALALAPNAIVADIGSGTGYFSVRLAHFVAKGRVYGVDTEADMVNYLAQRAQREKLANVTSLAGMPDSPNLPVKVDVILMVDVFHHISNRGQYFKKLKDVLEPGGRIALIDFNKEATMGPPIAQRIPADQVKAELSEAGYVLAAEHTFLLNQYFLVFKPIP